MIEQSRGCVPAEFHTYGGGFSIVEDEDVVVVVGWVEVWSAPAEFGFSVCEAWTFGCGFFVERGRWAFAGLLGIVLKGRGV